MPTATFWLEPTDEIAVGLRRYTHGEGGFDCAHGHHAALAYTGVEPAAFGESNGYRHLARRPDVDHADPAWPSECDRGCGYRFTDADEWQSWQELVYRRTDTGQPRVLHRSAPAPDAPAAEPGASWDAWWMPEGWAGPDGLHVMVRLPNGRDWHVDGQASNCTRPGEPHKCWIRHGDPRKAELTVDKDGDTCSAGAGSIAAGDYHGFLRGGWLEP